MAETEQTKEEPKDEFFVSVEEGAKAAALPAVLVNRFIVNWDAYGIRLTFGDMVSEKETVYRTSVVMTMANAISLHQLLARMLKDAGVAVEVESSNG